ncbi:hypothetical protein GP5015_1806 [gamma proteobacterium HTCC5015]|nr:hypothetical protein GP5015_1806 [gamma proteobacterium HTCC5015]
MYFSEAWFPVGSGEEGIWTFRFGGDFGYGGGLYVDDQVIDEDWANNLWWANNWGSPSVVQGSISLTQGYHSIRIIGFEDCCDGGATVQFRKPGGAYQAWNTTNLDIRSRQCHAREPTVSFGANSLCAADMTVDKSVHAIEGVVNMELNPGASPGNTVTYEIQLDSVGPGPAISSVIVDDMANFTALRLDTYGAGQPFSCVSGCGAGQGEPQLGAPEYSDDNGATWTYTPVSGGGGAPANYDANVTHWRIAINNPIQAGESVAIRFDASIE